MIRLLTQIKMMLFCKRTIKLINFTYKIEQTYSHCELLASTLRIAFAEAVPEEGTSRLLGVLDGSF